MDLKDQIKLIVDKIQPQFQTLGEIGFKGIGMPDLVVVASLMYMRVM